MYRLQIENIVKPLWHYEDHLHIFEKEGDPVQTPEITFIFVSESNQLIVINCFLLER